MQKTTVKQSEPHGNRGDKRSGVSKMDRMVPKRGGEEKIRDADSVSFEGSRLDLKTS